MNNKKCPHGLDVDPVTGMHIIPNKEPPVVMVRPRKYEVVEHETGIKYEVTEHPKQEQKPKIDLNKELERLVKKEFPIKPKPQTEQEKQFEASVKKWKQYYKDNQGKIPDKFPKSIFD